MVMLLSRLFVRARPGRFLRSRRPGQSDTGSPVVRPGLREEEQRRGGGRGGDRRRRAESRPPRSACSRRLGGGREEQQQRQQRQTERRHLPPELSGQTSPLRPLYALREAD
ncbi:uncharacterized protein V6R79_003993 [Siganus canaliculatus]